MRILYVASRWDYGFKHRGDSFEHWAFYDSLKAMKHRILYFDQVDHKRTIGRRSANSKLWNLACSAKADCMFIVLYTSELRQRVVESISARLHIPTVNWFTDDEWRFDQYTVKWAKSLDWCVTTSSEVLPRYAQHGFRNVIKSQWAHNPRVHKPWPLPKIHDVSFIGQPHSLRGNMLDRLKAEGVDLWTRGQGWHGGRLSQDGYAKGISQSKINLNFSNCSSGGTTQIKARTFEVPGCGGFLMTEYAPGLEEYFVDGKEIVVFNGYEDLREKIGYYLAHDTERERIADAGHKRCMAEHTYQLRFKDIFTRMGIGQV